MVRVFRVELAPDLLTTLAGERNPIHHRQTMALLRYPCEEFYDEIFASSHTPRPVAEQFVERLNALSEGELQLRQHSAEATLQSMGITFAVYGNEAGAEKIWPFDIVPRIVRRSEWSQIEAGLAQRIQAMNLFLTDIYNEGKIVKDGIVPGDLIYSSLTYRKQCEGFRPPRDIWAHVNGTDLVRGGDGVMRVLEDNLRCPSGVSYVLENREVMKRTFGKVFLGMNIAPIEDYPERLLETLYDSAPPHLSEPTAVVLTPGVYNSAYFEHSFLAQSMGIELVEGSDLVVSDGFVKMRTTQGLQRVDVIYRRIDDDFLDPKCFREDSCLGVPGLMEVYRNGRVALANAPGSGVADDKAVYAYVPKIIKYYLNEEAILPNVKTYLCSDPEQREYVIKNASKLVIKPTNESGGYGIVIGPRSSKQKIEEAVEKVKAHPRDFIAQPMLELSTAPTIVGDQLRPRHVDLRPFILSGRTTYVMPGGLTRVALREGSLIVNSSQGGGSKDTWVVDATDIPSEQTC